MAVHLERKDQTNKQGFHHECILLVLRFFVFILLSSSTGYADVETVTSPTSPITEISLQLQSSDGVDVSGNDTVFLGGKVDVTLDLLFADNVTIFNTSVHLSFPFEFVLHTPLGNVSTAIGDNLAASMLNVSYGADRVEIDLGIIESTNSSSNLTQDSIISASFTLLMFYPREVIGSFLPFPAEVHYVDGGIERTQNVTNEVKYGGPGVTENFQNSGFIPGEADFIPDRATSVNITLDLLSSSLTGVTIFLELSSADVSDLNVDFGGLTVTPLGTVNYTQPNITAQSQFSCSGAICTFPAIGFGNISAVSGSILMEISFTIRQGSLSVGDVVHAAFDMDINGESTSLSSLDLNVVQPELEVTFSIDPLSVTEQIDDYTYQYMHFTTTVFHSSASTGPASEVSITNDISALEVDLDSIMPSPYTSGGAPILTLSFYIYRPGVLEIGEVATLSYNARLKRETVDDNLDANITLEAVLTWSSLPASEASSVHPGVDYGPVTAAECITQTITYEESLLYNHGLAALFFFVALLVSLLLVVLAFFIYAKCATGGIYAIVQPEGTIAKSVTQHGLIINPRAGKTGLDMVEEYSSLTANESIVIILSQKDKSKKVLDFDNLDILGTITTDIQLEEQRISTMVELFVMLLGAWSHREEGLRRDTAQKLSRKYQRRTKDAIKSLEDQYRHDSRQLLKHLSAENKGKLMMMKKKHESEIRLKTAQGRNLDKADLKEVLDLLKQQQAAEVASGMQLLKLKQDEEQEKLRKEYATKKRIAIKTIQQEYLDQAILQGGLDEDQARALLQEHHQSMATVERLMDEEMSRQRMALEEKLNKRKLLAKVTESQEEYHRRMLNTMAGQTITAVNELENSEQLSGEEAKAQVERLMKDVHIIKDQYERERSKQEEALHKRLSERKKKRMMEKEKEHKQDLAEFEKEKKALVETGDLAPEEYMEARCDLLASQRVDVADIDKEYDEDARQELEKLREEMVVKVRSQIKDVRQKIHGDLQNKGLTEKQAQQIVEQHERDMEELMEEREEQRKKQEAALKKRLAKQRMELAQRKQEEREEREQIREHEEKMVGRLLASQVAMSEEERQRILAEHEQHLVAMENSLALTKLRQRRLLEEKMATRKSRQMERLAKKQEQEAKRKQRERKLDSDDEEDSTQCRLKEMMQKHTEEKMAMLAETSGDRDQLEEEMEAVRSEMLHERANALKEQEDRLGAVMAQLQMEKARELATIEEQHKALLQLKMNMLDELTEKGIMKNAQCKKVIETHQKQMEAVEQKLRKQRAKAEAETKRRLKEKAAERERALAQRQEEEMAQLLEREKSGTAARLKRIALKHKHMVQMEEFRNKLEIEMTQSLEELRRQSEVMKMKQQQEQELDFLSALVKVGNYERSELVNILHLLFPARSHDQVNAMLTKLYAKVDEEKDNGDSNDGTPVKKEGVSTGDEKKGPRLEDKVKDAILGKIQERTSSLTKKSKKKKSKKLAPLRSSDHAHGDGDLGSSMRGGAPPPLPGIRPDPEGGTATPDDSSDPNTPVRRRKGGYDDEEEDSEEGEDGDQTGYLKKKGSLPPVRKGRKANNAYY
ncbi:limbin-like [Diadema antillarum]|uniref:limbin-like n=1 Tax=Diadema antillarum TaxID=105358 RepID=UPI003A8C13F1